MNSKAKVIVIIPARNEEKYLEKTLKSLENQSVPPERVIVVDDGSTDNTAQIVENYVSSTFKLILKKRPSRKKGKSLVGTPAISTTFNIGFKIASRYKFDYIMILGADTILEKDYIKKLLAEFQKDPSLAIASGQSRKMKINPNHARGSGRLIDGRFWKKYGERYPPIYGWEDDCLIYCQRIGLKVRSFNNIMFTSSRKDQGTIDFVNWGRAARAMKYHIIIAIMRSIRFVLFQRYGIKNSVRFMAGYLSKPVSERVGDIQKENRKFTRKYQIILIPKKSLSFLKKVILR